MFRLRRFTLRYNIPNLTLVNLVSSEYLNKCIPKTRLLNISAIWNSSAQMKFKKKNSIQNKFIPLFQKKKEKKIMGDSFVY